MIVDMINWCTYVHLCVFTCINDILRQLSITECKTIASLAL